MCMVSKILSCHAGLHDRVLLSKRSARTADDTKVKTNFWVTLSNDVYLLHLKLLVLTGTNAVCQHSG